MQLTKRKLYDRIVMGIAALIWVFGLLAAGSDSIYMPWLNAVGAIIFLGTSLWLGRVLPRLEKQSLIVSTPRLAEAKRPVEKRGNPRENTRYAQAWSLV
jgi:hypothetical protein